MTEFDKSFYVQGSSDNYVVRIVANELGVRGNCTCPAGNHNQLCKHLINTIKNDDEIKAALFEWGVWEIFENYLQKNHEESQKFKKQFERLFLDSSLNANKDKQNNERSLQLIANFSKGYADGWKFAVRQCNYEALDIKLTSRVINGNKQNMLTQGKSYNFTRGMIFYDSIETYNICWRDALKIINNCVQIDFASNSDYGVVEFTLMTPDKEKTKLEKVASYSCHQDEFVSLLKVGEFADLNGELHKI